MHGESPSRGRMAAGRGTGDPDAPRVLPGPRVPVTLADGHAVRAPLRGRPALCWWPPSTTDPGHPTALDPSPFLPHVDATTRACRGPVFPPRACAQRGPHSGPRQERALCGAVGHSRDSGKITESSVTWTSLCSVLPPAFAFSCFAALPGWGCGQIAEVLKCFS